jgi:cytochrome c-type biogenesis protein
MVILFGLYTLGALNVGALARERRVHLADKPVGYLGTVLVGIAFGAGWTPCIGPILGSILILSSSSADLSRGLLLLTAYSLGLAIPFLLSALLVRQFLALFARMRRQMVWVTRAAGLLLVGVGLLMVTDYFTVLAGYLQGFTPEALRSRI